MRFACPSEHRSGCEPICPASARALGLLPHGELSGFREAGPGLLPALDVVRQAFGDEHHYTVWPPSITMACPVTKEAASEHSQTTAAAISSGFPIRPTGSCAITLSRPSGVPPLNRCIIGVSMIPGHTAFTRIFDCA